jgi:hypothetical protein
VLLHIACPEITDKYVEMHELKLQKDVTHFNRCIALFFLSLYLFSRSTTFYWFLMEEEGEEVALRERKGHTVQDKSYFRKRHTGQAVLLV